MAAYIRSWLWQHWTSCQRTFLKATQYVLVNTENLKISNEWTNLNSGLDATEKLHSGENLRNNGSRLTCVDGLHGSDGLHDGLHGRDGLRDELHGLDRVMNFMSVMVSMAAEVPNKRSPTPRICAARHSNNALHSLCILCTTNTSIGRYFCSSLPPRWRPYRG